MKPSSWSPNRLVFHVEPGQRVWVNQNPGSWWVINGRRPYASSRCAELLMDLSGVADASGRLEFRIVPPRLNLGWWLHGAGLTLLAAAFLAGRLANRTRGPTIMGTSLRGNDPAPRPLEEARGAGEDRRFN